MGIGKWRSLGVEGFERFFEEFKRFKKEMKNYNIHCECKVMSKEVYKKIHDRWIIIDDIRGYNVPSTDTIARGQYSSIYLENSASCIPFDDFWKNSMDIFKDKEKIKKMILG